MRNYLGRNLNLKLKMLVRERKRMILVLIAVWVCIQVFSATKKANGTRRKCFRLKGFGKESLNAWQVQ